jgi:plastin-1
LVTKAESDEDIMNNAKYVISVARMMGGTVFLVWEHIRDVNNFIFILI